MTNKQLEQILAKEKLFVGVYPIDKMSELPIKQVMGFILNLDESTKAGSHWVAVFLDAKKDMSVEYDPLAKDPPKRFLKDIKPIIDKLKIPVYLKLKINKIKHQADTTSTCGWHSARFLYQRFRGVPFPECSGFNDVKRGEANVKEFKKKFKQFGFI